MHEHRDPPMAAHIFARLEGLGSPTWSELRPARSLTWRTISISRRTRGLHGRNYRAADMDLHMPKSLYTYREFEILVDRQSMEITPAARANSRATHFG